MGWLYSESWSTPTAMRNHLRDELTRSGYTIKKDALTKRAHNYWAAIEKEGRTSILLCLINGSPRGGGYGYKDMDEFMGPVEEDCPESLLALASPIPDCADPAACAAADETFRRCSSCWAREWRTRVRAYHADRRARLALYKTVKVGDKVWIKNAAYNPFTVTSTKPFRGWPNYRLPHTRVERVEAA